MRNSILCTIAALLLFVFACKKDKAPQVKAPELTTTAVTSITANTAMSGGTISSNGGETISASGVCWSTTNQNPTISDDTTKGNTASGSFTAMLTNLNSSSTYYVRAYAINRVGTGYGNVLTFNTGNGAPTATSLSITGDAMGDVLLTANYTYSDPESDPEAGTTFQWYMADDATGTNEIAITDATESTFRIQTTHEGKYIRVGVTAKSSAGNMTGVEVKSAFIGAVGEGSTVTFTYDGEEVTYNVLLSATTGKKWLDRNLGATRTATAVNDYLAYGDLFQWGRRADGHQRVTRTSSADADAIGVTGITSTTDPYETSSSNTPETNKFIINPSGFRDWRVPQEDNLWQGVDGVNNPCPKGWRIPTQAEWSEENITSAEDAFTRFKMTYTGQRDNSSGTFLLSADHGIYWSSTTENTGTRLVSDFIDIAAGAIYFDYSSRAKGQACRCVKD